MQADADVVVVGAGAAGLACARRLRAAGLSVIVLEAHDRIGGRMHTVFPVDAKEVAELGAQVVHGDRAACWDYLGDPADHARYGEGATLSVRLAGTLYPAWSLVRSAGCLLWRADGVIAGDGAQDVPVIDVLRAARGRAGVDDEWVRQTWAGDPSELSAKGIADVLRGADSGDGEFLLACGFAELVRRLAEDLEIRTGHPVTGIDWRPGAVTVRSAAGTTTGSACVMTVPPPVVAAGRCAISSLPAAKLAAAGDLRLGDALSVALALSEPAPEAVLVFDADAEVGFWKAEKGSHVALGVAKGATAERLRSLLAQPDALRSTVTQLLPWAEDAVIESVTAADWGRDPWATGAFTFPATGRLGAAAVWAEPLAHTVFFAGEATCGSRHPASVHGALESGLRAAAQVMEAVS